MPEEEYVFWHEDIWGWDPNYDDRADLLREMEIGSRSMVMEKWENSEPKTWFKTLEWTRTWH